MATISYINATCVYPGASAPSVDNLSLEVQDGEFMVLVGPSGSGKSTALRMLAGLEQVSTGEIRIDGTDVSQRAPKDRNIAMVFQNYALYPHMKPDRDAKIKEAARLLDLEPYLDRKPKALSGGQRQRVAMGRAIVREPAVFLMDEPLSNLDAKLRVETRANIAGLQARLGTTTIYVTHDQVEAMTMGHRVAVLRDGQLQQVDTPRKLYDRPANVFVAGFIGSPAMNLRTAAITADGATLAGAAIDLPAEALAAARQAALLDVVVGLRPEATTLASAGQSGTVPLTVTLVEELGADAYVYGTLESDAAADKPWVLRCDSHAVPTIGQQVRVTVDAGNAHVFNPATGVRLG
jgi:multiple sugar transport system ATP-binding protein